MHCPLNRTLGAAPVSNFIKIKKTSKMSNRHPYVLVRKNFYKSSTSTKSINKTAKIHSKVVVLITRTKSKIWLKPTTR